MGNCSDLPSDLVTSIEENVALYADKVRFRSVCVSWNANTEVPKMPNYRELQHLPWLLLPRLQDDNNGNSSHQLFNTIDRRFYDLDLPDSRGKIFKGSCFGWVISLERDSANLCLINPLTGKHIQLPPRTKFPDVKNYRKDKSENEYGLLTRSGKAIRYYDYYYVNVHYIDKVVLSDPPNCKDCFAVAIYGEYARLAYCKIGDAKWTFLYGGYNVAFLDLIFHKGKLHALSTRGEVLIFDTVSAKSKVTKMVPSPRLSNTYLLECSADGGLLIVGRSVERRTIKGTDGNEVTSYNTCGFTVFKYDSSNVSWIEVRDIGYDMIFLGFNASFSISSSAFCCSGDGVYKRNHIYFTDNMVDYHHADSERGGDFGVFDIEDQHIESLPGFECYPKLYWPPPVWVKPSHC